MDTPVTVGSVRLLEESSGIEGWWGPVVRAGDVVHVMFGLQLSWADESQRPPRPRLEARTSSGWDECKPLGGGGGGGDGSYVGTGTWAWSGEAEEFRLTFDALTGRSSRNSGSADWTIARPS